MDNLSDKSESVKPSDDKPHGFSDGAVHIDTLTPTFGPMCWARSFRASSSDPHSHYRVQEECGWFSVVSGGKHLHVAETLDEAKSFIQWHKEFFHRIENPNVVYEEGGSGGLSPIYLFAMAAIVVCGFILGFLIAKALS